MNYQYKSYEETIIIKNDEGEILNLQTYNQKSMIVDAKGGYR